MIKPKRMRRKVPVLRIKMERGASYDQIKDIPQLRDVVIDETIYAIKDGIEKNKKVISLFEVAYTDCIIDLDKTKWKSALENVIEYYIEKEDYTKCAEIRDLITKL
jgi:hypothetical protein